MPEPRVEAAGVVDAGFGSSGVVSFAGRASVTEVVALDDGSVLVGGNGPYLAKLTSAGNLDSSFANAGIDDMRLTTKAIQAVDANAPAPTMYSPGILGSRLCGLNHALWVSVGASENAAP